MQRTSILALLALTALAGPIGPAQAAGKPPLAAKLVACTTGEEPAARAATFTGSMPALSGTDHVEMRFTLLQRRGSGGPFRPVDVPDWAAPETSEPGRPGFVFTKRIGRLLAPAAYRARVAFAWYDAKGHVQRRTRRTTPVCLQPDPRPNLMVGKVTAAGQGGGEAAYAVTVINDGGATALPFWVTLTVGDRTLGPVTIGPLAPGTAEVATLTGARCALGTTIGVAVDVDRAVDESRRDDDVVQRPCPVLR
jgi:hypothetical protein